MAMGEINQGKSRLTLILLNVLDPTRSRKFTFFLIFRLKTDRSSQFLKFNKFEIKNAPQPYLDLTQTNFHRDLSGNLIHTR